MLLMAARRLDDRRPLYFTEVVSITRVINGDSS